MKSGHGAPWATATGLATALALLAAPAASQEEFTIAPPPGWVVVVDAPDTVGPEGSDEGQDTELILVSLQDRASTTGGDSYFRLRYRVRGAGSVQEDSQIEIGFNPAYQELILHSALVHRDDRDMGQLSADRVQVYDEESRLSSYVVDGRKTAVIFLEDVRAGDVIDYSFTLRGSNPVFDGHYSREFPLATSSRIGRLYARLLWEGDGEPYLRAYRTDEEPSIRRVGGATEYVWDLRDTEAAHREPRTPAWYRDVAAVQISDFASWSEVAAWGRTLFLVDEALPDELADLAQRLLKIHPDPLDRAEAALRFVQDDVRYLAVALGENSHRPYPPSVVLDRRYGDCKDKSLLLITLLEAIGIEAHPVLVSTVYGRHVEDFHPSADVFDHAIVRIRIGDEEYWVDPTRLLDREPLEPGASPYGAALVLASDTEGLTRLTRPEAYHPDRDIVTRLDFGVPGEGATMSVETTYRRDLANGIREVFQNTPRDEIARGALEFYADLYPGIEALGTLDLRDDEGANEIVVTERYRIEDFWYAPGDDGELVAELYPLEVGSSLPPGASGRRSMPLALDYPVWIRSVIEARSEAGWEIEPEDAVVSVPGVSFVSRVRVDGDVLRLTHEYEAMADHVPADASIEHQRGVERISNQLSFVITPPGPFADALDPLANVALLVIVLLIGAAVEVVRKVAAR